MDIAGQIRSLKSELPSGVSLLAVSKTYPPERIMEAYEAGQRAFGENRPQELVEKYKVLPKDIAWHQIGGLQTNKVKAIAPFVAMIHSVESVKLLETIQKEALKNSRQIDILFEVHIAQEEAKHGWDENDLIDYLQTGAYRSLSAVRFRGLMGVATNTSDDEQIRAEFERLHTLFEKLRLQFFDSTFDTLSMGMSGDYRLAIACGSTMIRVGSAIFGARHYGPAQDPML